MIFAFTSGLFSDSVCKYCAMRSVCEIHYHCAVSQTNHSEHFLLLISEQVSSIGLVEDWRLISPKHTAVVEQSRISINSNYYQNQSTQDNVKEFPAYASRFGMCKHRRHRKVKIKFILLIPLPQTVRTFMLWCPRNLIGHPLWSHNNRNLTEINNINYHCIVWIQYLVKYLCILTCVGPPGDEEHYQSLWVWRGWLWGVGKQYNTMSSYTCVSLFHLP